METFTTFAVFKHKHMEAKERFKVVYSAGAKEFLQRITSKAREKIISNARKASYTIDPKLFKKLTGTDLWSLEHYMMVSNIVYWLSGIKRKRWIH